MKQARYLNGILTINAVLLAGVLWVNVAEGGFMASKAIAEPPRKRMLDAGAQRQQMISELKAMRQDVRGMRQYIETSEMRVRVTSMPPVRLDGGSSK